MNKTELHNEKVDFFQKNLKFLFVSFQEFSLQRKQIRPDLALEER